MRKTKIVCTMGPACDSVGLLKEMIEAGMTVARLNMAHGDLDEHRGRIDRVRQAERETGVPIAIMLDIKGPEIRIGRLQEPSYPLNEGDTITLTVEPIVGDRVRLPVSYRELPQDVSPGSRILIDDGLIELMVEAVEGRDIRCRIVNGGVVKPHKGVNVPGVRTSLPGVTERDVQHLAFGVEHGIDIVAMSFVRKAADVEEVRGLLQGFGAEHVQIIAKIENEEGVEQLPAILPVADGLMVARGDLGVEIAAEAVPLVQKEMIRACNAAGKPVIVATHMLDSMQTNPRPTRAEASDVANAVLDGADAVMLSGETAAGKYPLASVATMARIAARAESLLAEQQEARVAVAAAGVTVTEAVCQAVVRASQELGAGAIITPTESGFTARMVAKCRPQAPIVAVSPNEHALRRTALLWGVVPLRGERAASTDEMVRSSIAAARNAGLVRAGELVVLSAGGSVGMTGSTNLMKIETVPIG